MGRHPGKWCRIYGVAVVKRNKGDSEIQTNEEDESPIDYGIGITGQIGLEK